MKRVVSALLVAALVCSNVYGAVAQGASGTEGCPLGRHLSAGHYVFDFRMPSLRTAISILGLTSTPKAVALDSVPSTGSLDLCLSDVTVAQAWAVLLRQNNLSYYDQDGFRYVGSAADLSVRFPAARAKGARVFAYQGDLSSAGDISKAFSDAVPGVSVFVDRLNHTVTAFGTVETLKRVEQLFVSLTSQSPTSVGAFTTEAVRVKNQRTEDIYRTTLTALGPLVAPNTVVNATDIQSILVSGSPEFIARTKSIVEHLDHPVPMVRLDVTVVAITPNNDETDRGVQFGGVDILGTAHSATSQATTNFTSKAVQINATINALQKSGHAAVLSRGALYARNGKAAEIRGQVTYPFVSSAGFGGTTTIEKYNTGADIIMTPTFLENGVLVNLDAQYATLSDFTAQQIPIISTNSAKGELYLKDDEALVIVGLYSDLSSDNLNRIPIASSIPLIGSIFNNRHTQRIRTEVAFVVVPHKGSELDSSAAQASPIGRPAVLDFSKPLFTNPPPAPTPAPVRAVFGKKP